MRVDAASEEQQRREGLANSSRLARVLQLCAAGHLSKGYAQFSASPLADMGDAKVRDDLRRLHPQSVGDKLARELGREPTIPELYDALQEPNVLKPDGMQDEPGTPAFQTDRRYFNEVFSRVPKMRAMSGDAVSYEELGSLYHSNNDARDVLYKVVAAINAGEVHPNARGILGDCTLYGIAKPDGGTRPIGVGAALRRLAGRCLVRHVGEDLSIVLTEMKPTPEELARALGISLEEARVLPCNAPLQLGVGVPGGAEILIGICRTYLERHPDRCIFSDDKVNGFNCVSRGAMMRGLRRWFPKLIPTVRYFYEEWLDSEAPSPRLWFHPGRPDGFPTGYGLQQACDSKGKAYVSAEGCQQGDPLGPFLWALGYHESLLAAQALNPATIIAAFLDDTYNLDGVAAALKAGQDGEVATRALAGVTSNRGKQEIYSPTGDLSAVPAGIRGSPTAPPSADGSYAGGRLSVIKVLGTFIGDSAEAARRLTLRVERKLASSLAEVGELRDSGQCNLALQVAMMINRYCANTSLVYFLRTMPLAATEQAARRHDELVGNLFHRLAGTHLANASQRSLALAQARLPVKLGGLGLTSMMAIREAALVGSWALVWGPIQRLCPQVADGVELEAAVAAVAACREVVAAGGDAPATLARLRAGGAILLPAHLELAETQMKLMDGFHRLSRRYDQMDDTYVYFDETGRGYREFHPPGLPPLEDFPPLSQWGLRNTDTNKSQSRYSNVIHHLAWSNLLQQAKAVGLREAVRFMSASQYGAGKFLDAVPSRPFFRLPSKVMLHAVQRRLGLPLQAMQGLEDRRSPLGGQFDELGDVAQNAGDAGHQTRHASVLRTLHRLLRAQLGAGAVEMEATGRSRPGDARPDLWVAPGALSADSGYIGDTKIFSPISSKPEELCVSGLQGARAGFGITLPRARRAVLGCREFEYGGESGKFDTATGRGYVAGAAGQYSASLKAGVEIVPLLFEVFGGMSEGVADNLKRVAGRCNNSLSFAQYDETTWAARKWRNFAEQQLSVALMWAVANEAFAAVGETSAGTWRAYGHEADSMGVAPGPPAGMRA
jgi:hypothetical protein